MSSLTYYTKYTSKSRNPTRPYRAQEKDWMYVADGSAITYGTCPNAELGHPAVRSYPLYLGGKNYAKPYTWTANSNIRATQYDWFATANTNISPGQAVFTYMPEDDLYNQTNANMTSYLSVLSNYLDNRRTAGFKVVFLTTLPRVDTNWNERWRRIQNDTVRTWVGTHCDSFCNFDAIPGISNTANVDLYIPWHDVANSTYSSGVFPTAAGHQLLANYLKDHLYTVHKIKL